MSGCLRVWLVQIGEPLPIRPGVKRMRTALLARELARRGHEVVWWASQFDHGSRTFVGQRGEIHTLEDRIQIFLLRALGYRRNVSVRRYLDHMAGAVHFRSAARQFDPPDIIVAATPDHILAAEAAAYARSRGIPYVVDVRDPWPDSFSMGVRSAAARRAVHTAFAWDRARTRRMLRGATGVIAVMDGLLEWGLEKAGRRRGERDAVFHLGTEPLAPPDAAMLAALRDRVRGHEGFVPVYVGTFGKQNHPEVLLQAARMIQGDGAAPTIPIIVGGAGDRYESLRDSYGRIPGVHFTGWLNAAQVSAVLSVGSVGVNPWAEGEAFPNKVFAYLAAGLPLVSSTKGELAELIEREGIGVVFEQGDAKGLANILMNLRDRRDSVLEMAARARKLHCEKFEAERIYRAYADHVERVANVRSTRVGEWN